MVLSKEIKEMEFKPYSGPEMCSFMVYDNIIKQKNRELHIFDFVANRQRMSNYSMPSDVRLVIDKEKSDYYIVAGDKSGRKDISELIGGIKYSYPEIEKTTETHLKKVIGAKGRTDNHCMAELMDFLRDIRWEHKAKTREKNGYIQNDYISECPTELPDGLERWIRGEILSNDKTLVYKKGNLRGTCYLCGRKVTRTNKRFIQNNYVRCPDCGSEVLCVLEGGASWRNDYVKNIAFMQKDNSGAVWIRVFHIVRDTKIEYKPMKKYLDEIVRYCISKGGKVAMWQKERKQSYFMRSIAYECPEWQRTERVHIYEPSILFTENIEETTENTCLQYAKIIDYIDNPKTYTDAIQYAISFARYPVMEFLYKSGFYQLVNQKIGHNPAPYAIRWQQKKLADCFKFPLRMLKLQEPHEWNMEQIDTVNNLYKIVSEKELLEIVKGKFKIDILKQVLKYMTLAKFKKYIEFKGVSENDYKDYIIECEKLKFDMKNKSVLFPKDFKSAHNRTMNMVDFEENKAMYKKFEKIAQSLERFNFEGEELLIRVAKTPHELKREGSVLHHCVGGYAERVAKKETSIFFIRQKDNPDAPYFTLELRDKKIVQCRGRSNKSYEHEANVKMFVDKWYSEIVLKEKKKTA